MRLFSETLEMYYERYDDHVAIMEGDHMLESALIPESIDDLPVTVIFKKAFLGCKLLRKIVVPDSVSVIGDFAFALCDHLQSISLPNHSIDLGQSIFKNDYSLSSISVRGCEHEDHTAALLAAATNQMDADYLIDVTAAGSDEWFRMWDQKLSDFLNRKDDEGYHLYVLCGEEDLHFDYDQYVEYIREKKSGLCILRLLNDSLLSEATRKLYIDFLSSHVNIDNVSPVFNYLLKAHGDDEEYFEVLIRYDIITAGNREVLLGMMGDRHLQAKTYLINAFTTSSDDFFGDLML